MTDSTEEQLRLKDRWLELFDEDAPADLVDNAGDDLIARWSEPQRIYHTLGHLQRMLDVVDAHHAYAAAPRSVELACWFHDAIYDPTRHDNEDESAELAEQVLAGLGVAASDVSEVARLVRVTTDHEVATGDRNGALLVDADLAILAAEAAAYHDYVVAVRAEYAHVGDAMFGRGRAAVLRRLLDLPRLFHVPQLSAAWEQRARANLISELNALDDEGRPL